MEGPILPEGSGDAESPEELWGQVDERALWAYEARMRLFEEGLIHVARKVRRRRWHFSEYVSKNCEEAWGGRRG